MTAIKYFIDQHLRIARALLKDAALPVERVAEQTGFADSTYLEQLFKQKYQISPSEVNRRERCETFRRRTLAELRQKGGLFARRCDCRQKARSGACMAGATKAYFELERF